MTPSIVPLLDEQRPGAQMAQLHRQQLLRRPKPLVIDHRHHRRRMALVALQQQARIASTCAGARHTIARSRRPLDFSTCWTGFGPATHRHRIACLNMLCRITTDIRTG